MKFNDTDLQQVEALIGHTFARRELLEQALTHASIADNRLASNERLEFLGDAVLGMIVCDELFHRFPSYLEGDLTKVKSATVSRRMCAKITRALGLDQFLLLGKGMKTRAKIPPSLSAAVLESIIGAIYLDAGLDAVRQFILEHLRPHIQRASESGHQQNFKSVLQQYAQRNLAEQPVYVLSDERGPDHDKVFEVCAKVGERCFSTQWASSKKQAEQKAAEAALLELGLLQQGDDGHAVYIGDNAECLNGTCDATTTDVVADDVCVDEEVEAEAESKV